MINWKNLYEKLSDMNRIVLSTHENPDGDGLGCAYAMHHIAKKMNVESKIITATKFSKQYNFLNQDNCIELYDYDIHYNWIKEADAAFIFDVGDFVRLRDVGRALTENKIYTFNIDHHPSLKNSSFNENYVDTAAAATGEMIYEFIKRNEINFTKDEAIGVYTAIMTDTGSFRHSNTNSNCHKIAMECIELGVNSSRVYQSIYENRSIAQVSILSELSKNLNFELDGEFAWFVIDQDLMIKTKAHSSDVDGFTDFVRTIEGVEVSLMFYQIDNENCRINFRSKGSYILNGVAQKFGGGGHKFACGAKIQGNIKETISMVTSETKDSILNQRQSNL